MLIAFDTNILVRMAVLDDPEQCNRIKIILDNAEGKDTKIFISFTVIIETVWVLESVYKCSRTEIVKFLFSIIEHHLFVFRDVAIVLEATKYYERGGDFADGLICEDTKDSGATVLFSFDKSFINRCPNFVLKP